MAGKRYLELEGILHHITNIPLSELLGAESTDKVPGLKRCDHCDGGGNDAPLYLRPACRWQGGVRWVGNPTWNSCADRTVVTRAARGTSVARCRSPRSWSTAPGAAARLGSLVTNSDMEELPWLGPSFTLWRKSARGVGPGAFCHGCHDPWMRRCQITVNGFF